MKESAAPAKDDTSSSEDFDTDSSFEDDDDSEELKNEGEPDVTENIPYRSKEESSQEKLDSTNEKRFINANNA